MEKYNEINNNKKQSYRKYQKYLRKALYGILIGIIGLVIPIPLLNQLNDLLWAIGMLFKISLIGFGFIKTFINISKADKSKDEFERESDNLDTLTLNMQDELELSNNKIKEYEQTLEKIKNDYEDLKRQIVEIKTEKGNVRNINTKNTMQNQEKQYKKTR